MPLAVVLQGSGFEAEPKNLHEWLALNEPRVIKYLGTLGDKDVGEIVNGVVLSDGTRALSGLKFLGPVSVPELAHGYRFSEVRETTRLDVHYFWVSEGGTPLPVPPCEGEWVFPNGRGAVLSGDVYTWQEIQPGYRVVRTTCELHSPVAKP